jgi:hypothetical protein
MVRKARGILWDRRGNPTPYVSGRLGIEEWQLRDAMHKIKDRSGLGGTDRLIIYDSGDVTDERGEDLGNIHDEV